MQKYLSERFENLDVVGEHHLILTDSNFLGIDSLRSVYVILNI